MKFRWTFFRSILVALVFVYVFFWMPLPYVVVQPGKAESLDTMVSMANDDRPLDQEGSLMLTTIRMTYPHSNAVSIIYGLISSNAYVTSKSTFFGDEDETEYSSRQEYIMLNSQSNALQAAYNAAGIEFDIRTTGVMILSTVEGMPAAEVIEPRDFILSLDDVEITEREHIFTYMDQKSIGDQVTAVIQRGGEELTVTLEVADLAEYSEEETESRAGLGIVPVDLLQVVTKDQEKQINISAEDIGGPSAGLMFALQVYNHLTDEDITKGYRIAGTGTITPDGRVGVIGGADFKVVAADRADADIFFVPNDWEPPADSTSSPILNATLAIEKAKQIKTDMKIVPVATLQEALDYLASLPPKGD